MSRDVWLLVVGRLVGENGFDFSVAVGAREKVEGWKVGIGPGVVGSRLEWWFVFGGGLWVSRLVGGRGLGRRVCGSGGRKSHYRKCMEGVIPFFIFAYGCGNF